MSNQPAAFWTDDTSVFFTSFWGWSPGTWGCVGWTGEQGLSRRTNLLPDLTDPFIAVIYVTKSTDDEELAGKIVGFYLMSHEKGHRNELTHPSHHTLAPEKWEHSVRALRAFTYVPEHRILAEDFDPGLARRARPVTKWGEVLTDSRQIARLRETPWVEVPVYAPKGQATAPEEELAPTSGFNRAGPANQNGYVVSSSAQALKRQLYILLLEGSTDDYLGQAAKGKRIYKIGLSASPEIRRQTLQSGMPKGAFIWMTYRTSGNDGMLAALSFDAAVAGENAMKKHLAANAEWLTGEFYLASEKEIEAAWRLGCDTARRFKKS